MGDPLSEASLDKILENYELERKDLEFKCPRGIIDRIAGEIVNDWHQIGRALNVSKTKLKSINCPRPEDKAVAMLDTWAEECGRSATCLSLARALYRNKKRSVVEILCEEVQRFEETHVTTPVTHAAANHHPQKDQPMYDEQSRRDIIQAKKPIFPPAELNDRLKEYISQAVILLHTVKEEEMLAACKNMTSPVEFGNNDRPISWFDGKIKLMLGIFGDHKAVLIQTSKGADCQRELLPALQHLPTIKVVIGLGFAYGRRSKCNLGDVLVSTFVDGVGNMRIEKGRLRFDEGISRHTPISLAASNLFTKGTSMWTPFQCSKAGRKAVVHAGVLISSPMLVNDGRALDEFLMNNDHFIGGEMEGQELARAQTSLKEQHSREVDIIVIKGVGDFGDGTKAKEWQLTASLAAANFAEYKLKESNQKVYYIPGAEAATQYVHVRVAEDKESCRWSFNLCIIRDHHIKKCNGCKKNFWPSKEKPLTPPDDLIVSHLEQRTYTKQGVTVKAKDPSNAYYHLDIGCIKFVNPKAELSEFAILDSEKVKLTDAHKKKLQTLGMTIV